MVLKESTEYTHKNPARLNNCNCGWRQWQALGFRVEAAVCWLFITLTATVYGSVNSLACQPSDSDTSNVSIGISRNNNGTWETVQDDVFDVDLIGSVPTEVFTGDTIKLRLRVINREKATLLITRPESSCGCTIATFVDVTDGSATISVPESRSTDIDIEIHTSGRAGQHVFDVRFAVEVGRAVFEVSAQVNLEIRRGIIVTPRMHELERSQRLVVLTNYVQFEGERFADAEFEFGSSHPDLIRVTKLSGEATNPKWGCGATEQPETSEFPLNVLGTIRIELDASALDSRQRYWIWVALAKSSAAIEIPIHIRGKSEDISCSPKKIVFSEIRNVAKVVLTGSSGKEIEGLEVLGRSSGVTVTMEWRSERIAIATIKRSQAKAKSQGIIQFGINGRVVADVDWSD